ncbi:DNA repair protein complementing XP-C cells homolog [Hylaeus anthracinus]|uniref:DNA repair protein complementing XP-C cells homolog n=1 Tax=Hylaeus anthracinus TaxID=313031 RepID=UPI0023B9A0EF|nr:DNA repair protein complementing XP-C cells homolog [Hylaeus anthracinus]
MSGLSEDDSSDSNDDFRVNSEKITASCSFFEKKPKSFFASSDTKDESSDEEDLEDVNGASNIELFAQVLKNLEISQQFQLNNDNVKKEQSFLDPSVPQRKEEKGHGLKIEGKDAASSNEINELLLLGENVTGSPDKNDSRNTSIKEDTVDATEYTIPKDGIEIILPGTSSMLNNKKKNGGQSLKTLLLRRLKANEIYIEKVGLLCWLAYGFHLNKQVNDPEVMSTALSLLSTNYYPKNRVDLGYLEKFTKWFKHIFTFDCVENNANNRVDTKSLLKVLREKKICDYRVLVLLYVATARALGLNCRLVVSLCPPHRVLRDNPLFKLDKPNQQDKSTSDSNTSKGKTSSRVTKKKTCDVVKNSLEAEKIAKMEAKKRAAEVLQSKSQSAKRSKSNSNKKTKTEPTRSTGKESESKLVEEGIEVSGVRQLRSRRVNVVEDSKAKKTKTSNSKNDAIDGTRSKYYIDEDSADSEAEFQPKPQRVTRRKLKDNNEETTQSSKNPKAKNKKLLSSDSEIEDGDKKKRGQDLWAEVYLESEESWISVNVMDEKIHCVADLYRKASKPVLYVVAWNSENLIKDVTKRYCPHWLTVTRKQRIEEKWWVQTLSYWREKDTAISRAEDEMFLQKELEQPLPKTIGECKGHPLYVLTRHLLKFEALYPPDCVPLGYTSTGEPIYSRHCVHTLCSRETWLKKARVVKPKEEPYKIVKARPKYDKLTKMKINDLSLEVFGEWQTTEYVPPEAKNGIVPRNEYGNVDLFKQCMLPKGTVHINLPALNRIARKLNIDCAPAVVGFNFGCMGAVPAIEGYVVCSEYEDTLREAWEAEQVEAAKRAKEKREKRVYGNWKKLIQGLFIRERLAARYNFSQETTSSTGGKRKERLTRDAKKARVS